MSDQQDWVTVVFRKKTTPASRKTTLRSPAPPSSSASSTSSSIVVAKADAATNRQRDHDLARWKAVVNDDCETFRHPTIAGNVSHAIQQARQRKGMTQKELATKINEQLTVVQQYENKRAIPSDFVLGKMERALGVRLRGKHVGEPIVAPPK